MEKQQKIIEELQKIESFAEMLLEKCYSMRDLLSLGGVNPRATSKKKSQSKINQVIANRNKALRKPKDLLLLILLFSLPGAAQDFKVPTYESVCSCLDIYFEKLTDSQIDEFRLSNTKRWLNYLPSPGYSPFTGGFTVSFNLSAPIQEVKTRAQVKQKISSIKKTNELELQSLKMEVKASINALENLVSQYKSLDTLELLKHKAFALVCTQYERNEITPTQFIANEIEYENFKISRLASFNTIQQKILELLIEFKCPVP